MKNSLFRKIIYGTLVAGLVLGLMGYTTSQVNVNAAKRHVTRTTKKATRHKRTKTSRNRKSHKKRSNKRRPAKRRRRKLSRIIQYRFVTQTGRGNANDACEAASLLMALHHFGLAKHKNLNQFVRTIPRSRNPEKGYTGNPYKSGTGASLYPQALLKVAKRYGAKHSYIIDDYYSSHHRGNKVYRQRASVKAFIRAILHGYPVVFEGGNRMQYGGHTSKRAYRGYRSDHVLLLYGYKNHRFYWTDPDHITDQRGSTHEGLFMYIINAPVRGPRAVAIGK